ncbi:MAG: acetate kinase [Vibrionaceae bacterium]
MEQLILILNAGSSSLKFAVMAAENGRILLSGLGECFGLPNARISWKENDTKHEQPLQAKEGHHEEAISIIVSLVDKLQLTKQLVAVGHRVVHGGEKFSHSVNLTGEVIAEIEKISELAPLHNPANVQGIRAAIKAFPTLPQVAVFDTAFHQSMPAKAYCEAVDNSWYKEYGIRRYGFHGTSHYFVSNECAKLLGKPIEQCNLITVHLGNGASVCAVKNGKSCDTSMGFTPLAGLMMGTRSGDIDPGIIEFLLGKGVSVQEVFTTLNKKSGFLGVSGLTSDARGIIEGIENGHAGAKMAFDLFCYRVAKFISSYLVALDRLDGIVFTGGIGENSLPIRQEILRHLQILGFVEDEKGNQAARFGQSGKIAHSAMFNAGVFVIPTNEEWVIAQETVKTAKK